MKYNLNLEGGKTQHKDAGMKLVLTRLMSLVGNEKKNLYIALLFIFINSGLNLIAPYLMGKAVDEFIVVHQYEGLIRYSIILLGVFLLASVSGYTQAQMMGQVGQRMLFNLRNAVFSKLQELPIEFFNQNKAGDLISRVNNDTDKINQFFSQSLVQFMNSIFTMLGAGIFLLTIQWKLALAALIPAAFLWVFTKLVTPWVKSRNAVSLKSSGNLSAEIQESLHHFKVIIAFNRRDYFRQKFDEVNKTNFSAAVKAGIANNVFLPVYGLATNVGQWTVLGFGIYLISSGEFSVGLLISFLAYILHFYNPLRQIAALWSNFQVALAGWDRIQRILEMDNNLIVLPDAQKTPMKSVLSFENVYFRYVENQIILENVSFELEAGKTYAFVGPTGGGKSTTAALMSRLYDPQQGKILLHGKDIRSYDPEQRAAHIGFILQEPYLFSGSIRDNITYGSDELQNMNDDELTLHLQELGLSSLLGRFEDGLSAQINPSGEGLSLGQKQLIAFIRTVLRKPDVLILDEATANIDTMTEKMLDNILNRLPANTTRIVIAHRLNTIENADEIYFVNTPNITKAGSMQEAVQLLMHGKRKS